MTKMGVCDVGSPLTKEQLVQIQTLASAGVSQREISKRLNIHKNTVWKHMADPNFRPNLAEVREATKRVNAVKVRENVEKVHRVISDKLDKSDAFGAKAATGALKDLDQIQAVACGDEAQAGVAAAPSPVDLKVLIAQLTGNATTLGA
jgi:IS30 family transposase